MGNILNLICTGCCYDCWHVIYVLISCLGGYKLLDANYVYYTQSLEPWMHEYDVDGQHVAYAYNHALLISQDM